MRVGIATSAELRSLKEDELLLQQALSRQGLDVFPLVWTEWRRNPYMLDAIVIRTVWDYYRMYPTFMRFLAKSSSRGIRLINDIETMRWNVDKKYLKDLGDWAVPSLHLRGDEADVHERLGDWNEIVIKPSISASSFLTVRTSVRDRESIAKALADIRDHSRILIQPYLPTVETDGEASLIFFSGEYSHSVLKQPKRGDFRVQADHGGEILNFEPESALIDRAQAALSKVPGDWTIARVDFLNWRKDPWIGEMELIEPELFLRFAPGSAEKLAERIVAKL